MENGELKPRVVFVHIDSKYGWDVDDKTGYTDDIEYILKSEYDQLKVENERLQEQLNSEHPTGICEICTSKVIKQNEELKGVLSEIANSAGVNGTGFTSGEGHADCIWKARDALKKVTK